MKLKLCLVLLKEFIKEFNFVLLAMINVIFCLIKVNVNFVIIANFLFFLFLAINKFFYKRKKKVEEINLKDLQYKIKFTVENQEGSVELLDEAQIYELLKYVNYIERFIESHGLKYEV